MREFFPRFGTSVRLQSFSMSKFKDMNSSEIVANSLNFSRRSILQGLGFVVLCDCLPVLKRIRHIRFRLFKGTESFILHYDVIMYNS